MTLATFTSATTRFLGLGSILSLAVSGCSNQLADNSEMAPAAVIAALEAAARGEPHPDDLHPDTARSGKAMTPTQAAFDVQHYTLSLKVMPETRSIDGRVDVRFDALEALDTVQLDLDPRLSIKEVTLGDTALSVRREAGSFFVTLPSTLAAGASATISVAYGGKPHVALAPPWFGGFVWSEVDGTPWFATAVQGDGCDLWWPCKDNFADKPDEGIDLAISAPRGVKIASVGVLRSVDEGDDGFDTWHWSSRHPYSGYAVAINGGPYELVEDEYTGVSGSRYPIQFWALKENADKARDLVNSDVIPDLEFFERLLGPYPWGDEKAGFVETPHLGMEHQTINGYGEQYKRGRYGYDWLLHHELAHEWFGNVMTHARPEDAWLHEGYGAYMQAVYAEETVGAMGYFDHMYGAYTNNEHCLPVANPEVMDAGEAFDNRDIYTKGSWMLHSLRRYIGEDAFWAGTRRLIYDTAEPWSLSYPIQFRYRSTEDFIAIMSDEAGEDVSWIVETYLREAGMPELITSRDEGKLSLAWEVPGDRDFPMPVEVSIDGERVITDMSSGPQSLAVPEGARVLIDPDSKILRTLPIIGDCSEQTEQQIQDNIERFTRMAKDYGWQRD
ncbi:M1 family metallopeptidase [Congregibacter litoralis]|uniref:Aminopeptidase N n=1 Tax=Congregibacter litoralis KT71 TaxID=314285 RepID=A4A759_9GAMM|nr:M1 family metallopeptidase [Congregibacter litoralis]EAQ98128.1 Aminopeptidase N [Congregibacter litoralis KT71]